MAPTKVRTLRVGDEVWAKWGDAAAARGESIAERVHRAMLALEKVEAMATLPDMRLLGTDGQAEDLEPARGVTARALPTAGEDAASRAGRVGGGGGVEPDSPAGLEDEQRNRHESISDLAQGRRLKRTRLCEHRVPPTSHCSRCDP